MAAVISPDVMEPGGRSSVPERSVAGAGVDGAVVAAAPPSSVTGAAPPSSMTGEVAAAPVVSSVEDMVKMSVVVVTR